MKDKTVLPDYLILFDGVCKFCNNSINFTIRHDKRDVFRFAPFQAEIGAQVLTDFAVDSEKLQSVILIERGTLYVKSTAALRIARKLNGLWPCLYVLIIVPPFLRNWIYDWIARNRYKWFGKMDACMVPTPEVRRKFIA